MVERIDKALFDKTYDDPHGGVPKTLKLLLDKINELVDEQNKIRLGNR